MVDRPKLPDDAVRPRERSGWVPIQKADPAQPALILTAAALRGRAPSADIIARAIRTLMWVGLLLLFVWLTLNIDLVIFAGVLLAICLRRASERVRRHTGLPIGLALALVVLIVIAFFSAIGWYFSQAIASQIDQLSQQLPAAATKFSGIVGQSDLGRTLIEHLGTANLVPNSGTLVSKFFGVASNFVEVIGGIVVIIFLGLYFCAETPLYASGVLRLVPPARRSRAGEILHETASAIWYWMLGRLFSMTVLGSLTALGLWIIGVPLPVALGFLAGILTFIPYIGAFVSAIPSVLLAASVELNMALYVIVLYVGVHIIEGYILVPLVQRRVVHLPPALTLSAQIILGFLAGFLGLLFATPLMAAALVLIRMIYVEDVLGDRTGGEPAPFESRK